MSELVLLFSVFTAGFVGFACFALSQKPHWRKVMGTHAPRPRQTKLLRLAGSGSLALALVCALLRDGPSFGIILWVLALSVCAFAVAMVLAFWQSLRKFRNPIFIRRSR